jgi:dihydropyrimidinase
VAPGEQLAAATEISVRGLTVFPGAVDVHLHLGHGKDIAQPRVPLAKRQRPPKAA